VPRTPLFKRLEKAGRLISEHLGDQFVFTNVVPSGMTRLELYEGYQRLLHRLYDYANFRRRAMAFVLGQGTNVQTALRAGWRDLAVLARILWACVFRASPRRAWMTVSMVLETAWRRPRRLRVALGLALMHKHFYEYVRETSRQLDRLIVEMRTLPEVGMLPRPDERRTVSPA
jgi:hypothetical protein